MVLVDQQRGGKKLRVRVRISVRTRVSVKDEARFVGRLGTRTNSGTD